MTAQTDITNLGADHLYDFDGDSLDGIGSVNGTNSGVIFSDSAIALDATNCMTVNGLTDRVTLATTTEINNSAQQRKAVVGWYETTGFQAPPTRIYGEGNETTNFQIVMGFGNQLMFEVAEPTNFPEGLQVYGPSLQPDRAYHIAAIFLGNTQGNEVKLFVDGIEQVLASPLDRQPNTADLNSRGAAEFGDPSGTVGIGGGVVLQQAARNGKYQHWATWGDEADADLTDSEVRVTLFERQSLAESSVTSTTESGAQTAYDALADARGDSPLSIEVDAITGNADFTITSDKTFDDACSMHVRYNGTAGTLTLVNTGAGNATPTLCGAPFGGSIVVANRQTLTVTALDADTKLPIEGARVYFEADTGGDLPAGTVIMNELTNSSGVATTTFDYTNDQPIRRNRVRKGSSSPYYKTATVPGPLTATPLNITALMAPDE